MKKWIKIFIVLLIAITIPAQGVASVAMMNCGKTPHSFEKALEVHQHDMHHAHDTAHSHSNDSELVEHPSSHSKADATHACTHCVKCANCCAGFTFQSSDSHSFQQPCFKKTKFHDQTLLFTGFIPSGLERPPRLPLL